jgi:lambda family phage tail tape measure protein
MKQFLVEMIKATAQAYILKPLLDSIKSGGGGGGGGISGGISSMITSMLGMANGGAFNGGVQAFANGGVVGSATAFRHAGGLGVMGEAGPEAIMPLTRLPGGKLGVQARGSAGGEVFAPQISVHVAGGLTAITAEGVAQMIHEKIAMAKPGFINDAKSAVRRENTDNPGFMKR